MEKRHLVESSEVLTLKPSSYGSVNSGEEEANCKECGGNPKEMESSFENKVMNVSAKSCSCTHSVGRCECGEKQKNIQLDSWDRYKTITMLVGLSLFAVWIIVITTLGQQGKL